MNCKHVQIYLDSLLIETLDEEKSTEIANHIANCPKCARDYDSAQHALEIIRPEHSIKASAGLKERIMNGIHTADTPVNKPSGKKIPFFEFWKPVLITTIAAVLIVAVSLFMRFESAKNRNIAENLLTEVWAAEQAVFTQKSIVHIANEIVVKPLQDPVMAQLRWFPVVSIKSDGKPRYHQLSLPADVGESYTVDDDAWYDPATGRFQRIFSVKGVPVFAQSFDGASIYSFEEDREGTFAVSESKITRQFNPPANPSEFLGISAGLTNTINENEDTQISYEGDTTLSDGSKARILKYNFGADAPDLMQKTYVLFKIREKDNTIAEMEWILNKESALIARRVKTESLSDFNQGWNLAELVTRENTSERPKAGMKSDMIIPNVTVQHMLETADFETYIFATDPKWTSHREIVDILDIPNPPHRMFSIVYRAGDSRHVVLNQGHSYNTMIGRLTKTSTLDYTSPNGFKTYSNIQTKWIAKILLESSKAMIHDLPSENRTGYFLESPDGTFFCLAVNGKMTDDEFHNLIDSLVPAKEYVEK